MNNDSVGFHWMFILMGYGVEWRQHRRAFHRIMNQEVMVDWHPVQLKVTRKFLYSLLRTPDQLGEHLKLCVISMLRSPFL